MGRPPKNSRPLEFFGEPIFGWGIGGAPSWLVGERASAMPTAEGASSRRVQERRVLAETAWGWWEGGWRGSEKRAGSVLEDV